VTKKGSKANKNRHFVDKLASGVNQPLISVDVCNTYVEAKRGRVYSKSEESPITN
jgi:hypothetical protein